MDLIDRAEVLHKFLEILPDSYNLDWYEEAKSDEVKDLVDELYSIVLNVNEIDAKPVKRGRWIPIMPDCRGYTEGFECSYCKNMTYLHCCEKDCDYEYCPNCGSYNGGE